MKEGFAGRVKVGLPGSWLLPVLLESLSITGLLISYGSILAGSVPWKPNVSPQPLFTQTHTHVPTHICTICLNPRGLRRQRACFPAAMRTCPGGTGQPCLLDALASGFTGQPPPYPLSAVFSRPRIILSSLLLLFLLQKLVSSGSHLGPRDLAKGAS